MEGLRTLFIFEILGKPAEHIKKSLNDIVDQLGKQKGVEIVRREVHEPKIVENKEQENKVIVGEELCSTFAEVEIITEDIKLVLAIVLNMLPSHVEILAPSDYRFKNFELSSFLTELTVKMHKFDEIAKISIIEKNHLLKKLNEAENRIRDLEKGIKEG